MSGQDHKRDSEADIGTFLSVLTGVPGLTVCCHRPLVLQRAGMVCVWRYSERRRGPVSQTNTWQVLQALHVGIEQFKSWVVSASCQRSFRQRISLFRWIRHSSTLALSTPITWWVFFSFLSIFFRLSDSLCLPLLFQFDHSCLNNSELVLETFYQLRLWQCQMWVCLRISNKNNYISPKIMT